jgi:hypothetical protein
MRRTLRRSGIRMPLPQTDYGSFPFFVPRGCERRSSCDAPALAFASVLFRANMMASARTGDRPAVAGGARGLCGDRWWRERGPLQLRPLSDLPGSAFLRDQSRSFPHAARLCGPQCGTPRDRPLAVVRRNDDLHAGARRRQGSGSWASLETGNCPGAREHLESRVRIAPLDDFAFPECGFLKVDVEGHELQVLEGEENTLRRTRPRILIEVRDSNLAAVDRFLESLDFRRSDIRNLIGCPGAPGNCFYMPNPIP